MARRDDQPRLVAFIRDHWSETHIFTERPDVFDWQYQQADGRLNMVLAQQADGEVLGVLGFIPMGRFAPALGDRDVLLAIWKVRDDGVPPGLGLRLLKFVQRELSPRLIAAIGTSEMVRPIYEVLGYTTGELHQSAIFHPAREGALRIARGVPDDAFEPAEPAGALELMSLDDAATAARRAAVDRIAAAGTPTKSWDYVVDRYLRHPWYRYDVRVVRREGDEVAVVVWRAVEAEGTRVLRIVDVIGDIDWLGHAQHALQHEVSRADAEYIDLMQWGIDRALLRDGGFVDVESAPSLVLPNYFSPFVPRNIHIELAVKVLDGSDADVRLFRADSDQDRPNLVSDLSSSR